MTMDVHTLMTKYIEQQQLLDEARELLLDVSMALDSEDERYERIIELSVRLIDWSA